MQKELLMKGLVSVIIGLLLLTSLTSSITMNSVKAKECSKKDVDIQSLIVTNKYYCIGKILYKTIKYKYNDETGIWQEYYTFFAQILLYILIENGTIQEINFIDNTNIEFRLIDYQGIFTDKIIVAYVESLDRITPVFSFFCK